MSVDDLRTERVCPRCEYTISVGCIHEEVPQPPGASHTVCALKRMPGISLRGPLVEVLAHYFTEEQLRRRAWAIPLRLRTAERDAP